MWYLADLLSSGVRSKVVKGQRTYRLFAGELVLWKLNFYLVWISQQVTVLFGVSSDAVLGALLLNISQKWSFFFHFNDIFPHLIDSERPITEIFLLASENCPHPWHPPILNTINYFLSILFFLNVGKRPHMTRNKCVLTKTLNGALCSRWPTAHLKQRSITTPSPPHPQQTSAAVLRLTCER